MQTRGTALGHPRLAALNHSQPAEPEPTGTAGERVTAYPAPNPVQAACVVEVDNQVGQDSSFLTSK